MALSGIISRALDSVDTAAEATVKATESKVTLLVMVSALVIAALVFLILFAVDSTLAIVTLALLIAGLYLLDIDLGGSGGGGGPRK